MRVERPGSALLRGLLHVRLRGLAVASNGEAVNSQRRATSTWNKLHMTSDLKRTICPPANAQLLSLTQRTSTAAFLQRSVRWAGTTSKFLWPPNLMEQAHQKGPIGDPDDPPLEKEIEVKSDEEMVAEAEANMKKAQDWLVANVTSDMSDEEIHTYVQRAMELHIPPLPSWQEMVMVEEEKKRRGGLGDQATAKASLERSKEMAMKRIPVIDKFGRAYATGKRKTSVARVWVTEGTGNVIINHTMMVDYFHRMSHREELYAPLRITGKPLGWDVWATVKGGGYSGQALAVRHGIAQALQAFNIETYRPVLKKFKYLTFDMRQVERKKPGQAGARKKFQWVKR